MRQSRHEVAGIDYEDTILVFNRLSRNVTSLLSSCSCTDADGRRVIIQGWQSPFRLLVACQQEVT